MKRTLLAVALLGLSSVAVADLSKTCTDYFNQVDTLVKAIPEDAATKAQTDMLKQNLEAGKAQIAALPEAQQESACKQGVDALKQLSAAMIKQ